MFKKLAKIERRTPGTYWILRRDQILCLASARRQDLLDRLVASGPSSIADCARAIGLARTATYHHMRSLEKTGLVELTGQRAAGRRPEALYGTVAPRMRMKRALDRSSDQSAVRRVVSAMCRQMDRDFASGFGRDGATTDGPGRTLGFCRLVGRPDPATLAEINRHLEAVAELLWRRRSSVAPLVALGWTMAPVGSRSRAARATRSRRRKTS